MSEGTIRKLRLNFIRSAMVTMVSVMLGISGLIFLTNAWLTRQTIRNILDYLIENDGRIIPAETMNNGEEIYDYSILHFLGEMINNEDSSLYKSPEFRFTTRYFAVKFDADEKLVDILDNHIASVTEEEAEHYGRDALKRRRKFGRYKSYYYQVGKKDDGSAIVVFLDSWIQVRANDRLLYSVFIMIGFGVIVTFLIVWFFSSKAIRAEIKNAELQKQFITDASHELKTPLAVIKANTEMQEMLEGETEWTQSTLRQVERLSGLIANLVMITKTQERENGNRTETNVTLAVLETIQTFMPVAANEHKTLTQSIEEKVTMKAVESEIRQLTSLLLDNAIKYCDPEGLVQVTLQRRGKSVTLVVANDYKEGKDVDYNLFFERFYRKDESHNADHGGYGIGLSIAENLVEHYKGSLTAKWNNGLIYFTAVLKE